MARAPVANAAFKKQKKTYQVEKTKQEKAAQAAAKKSAEDEKRLEDARNVVIVQDASLPAAKQIKIRDATAHRGQRVKIHGWVHRLRSQGKNLMFIVLRDGTGYLQSVLTDKLVRSRFSSRARLGCGRASR